METIEKVTPVTHLSVKLKSDFEKFTTAFEGLAGKITKEDLDNIAKDPEGARKHIETLQGYQGLMIFNITEHGALLALAGQKRFARQYMLGNPLFALSMTKHDIRAAIYAPLKVLVYVNDQHETLVEYDKPSDQFGQFGVSEITEFALGLDEKVVKLITKADE